MEQMDNKLENYLPKIRIKCLEIKNLKSFSNCKFDFLDNKFVCFIGPNGSGKSTALEIIQLLFTKYSGRDAEQLSIYLGKLVRHVHGRMSGENMHDDFLISAEIESDIGNYTVELNKNGFIKDHPKEIKDFVYRICYFSTIDKELHKFQLKKEKWGIFKELFELITGYEIYQQESLLSNISFDSATNDELNKYVFAFYVKKPKENVFYRDCSDGERKVIKSLASLLNMEPTPRIILIDNIEMHVEAKRHMPLVECLKRSFPESQIFSTTHSVKISKNLNIRKEIYDLRFLYASNTIKDEPWRLYMSDEIDDFISKAESLSDQFISKKLIKDGLEIKKIMMENVDNKQLISLYKNFVKDVEENFINDMTELKKEEKILS